MLQSHSGKRNHRPKVLIEPVTGGAFPVLTKEVKRGTLTS